MDLAEFLLARIAEDEAVARATRRGPEWHAHPDANVYDSPGFYVCGSIFVADATDAIHVARWDPARVLAECEAKRAIVESAARWGNADCRYGRCRHQLDDCDGGEEHWLGKEGWFVLTELALPYADHEDYQAGWRP
jgi:hypothetical protein